MQRIIYMAPASLATQKRWFGSIAAHWIIEIADKLKPFMLSNYPGIQFTYQSYYIALVVNGIERYYRVLSNRIPDCPDFHAIRAEETSAMIHNGYLDIDYPAYRGIVTDRVEHDVQRVLSRRTLEPVYMERIFGAQALQEAAAIDAVVSQFDFDGPIPTYKVYLVRQSLDGETVYEGLLLTNLLQGYPNFYPVRLPKNNINALGGYKPVLLPEDLKEEINSLDFRGCALEPIYSITPR